MMTASAMPSLRAPTVVKSVVRGPNEEISLIKSVKSLSVVKSGSCQCGSFFNLDPLKRGGRFDEIDEFERKKRNRGGVTTLLTTPSRGNRGFGLWKRVLSGGRYDMRLWKREFSKTTIGSGKSVAGSQAGERYERRDYKIRQI
jgi:hypothetical protein